MSWEQTLDWWAARQAYSYWMASGAADSEYDFKTAVVARDAYFKRQDSYEKKWGKFDPLKKPLSVSEITDEVCNAINQREDV